MIITAWNTGRLYTKAGQRIAAKYDPNRRRIWFYDVDRMVDGVIQQAGRLENAREVQEVTMHRYDHNQYDGPHLEDREEVNSLIKVALETAPCR